MISQNNTARDPDQPGLPVRPGYVLTIAVCAALLAAGYALQLTGHAMPPAWFLPMHMVLEFTSIVVSFSVFTTGWFGYRQTGNVRELIVAATFMATGAIDFVHTLSYKGMPDFLGPGSVGKAAAYWLLARLVVGVGLLLASFVTGEARHRRRAAAWCMGSALLLVIGSVVLFTVYSPVVESVIYNTATRSLTPVKIALEYVAAAIYLAAFLAVSEKRRWDQRSASMLRRALLVAIFSEISFTLYSSPYDWTNVMGHVFKTISYYLILNALFVFALRRPHEQLAKARDQLEALYADAQDHRTEIEQSFARIGSALSSSLRTDDALDQIAQLATGMLHADCSVVASADSFGQIAQVASRKGDCSSECESDALALAAGNIAIQRRKTVIDGDLHTAEWAKAALTGGGCPSSVICAPMIHSDDVLGVIAVFAREMNAFDEGDARLIEGFAAHAAVAIHNALSYERESRIADVLQRTFLSSSKIVTDRFEIAQVYQPAMTEALVGGDFYDVIEAPGGRLGLVIGDVSGKGLQAAVHTAMVKYTLRAYLSEGHSPGKAMELLNNVVCESTDDETFITTFLGLLNVETGELVYANAGHEPPLYTCGGASLTLPTTGPALGIDPDAEHEEGTARLEKGCLLVMYTDGISEARRGALLLGTEGLTSEIRACESLDSQGVAKCVHRAAIEFAGGELKDDAAILTVRAIR